MTEGCLLQHDKPMCVRVWLEVGHACEPRRSALGRALALDWRVWVRGLRGHDISAFVHKVVFHLHPASAFVYPKRVLQEPPYEIQESGCASLKIPIHVYLKYSNKPNKIKLVYNLRIENSTKNSSDSKCVYYDFNNPSQQFQEALMKGGGKVIARTRAFAPCDAKLLLSSESGDGKPDKNTLITESVKSKKYEFIEPLQYKSETKKEIKKHGLKNICSKCGEPTNVNFKKLLRSVSMTDNEIDCVSQLYLSYSNYEKSADALILPPITDPIYKMPELPPSVRGALNSIEGDYAMR